MHTIDEITGAVRVALSRRDERRDILARKIANLAGSVLDAARRRRIELGEAGILEYRTPIGNCSQWGNRMDYPDHAGEPVLMLVLPDPHRSPEVRTLGEPPDVGFHDGRNLQAQQGPTRDHDTDQVLRPATVAQLKVVATVLPAALAELLTARVADAKQQVTDADEAMAAL